jgi:hypothetical protein
MQVKNILRRTSCEPSRKIREAQFDDALTERHHGFAKAVSDFVGTEICIIFLLC